MTNNRQILPLSDLAFEALLRNRIEITPNSEKEYEVLIQFKLKKEISLFLQYIADADLDSAKELLEDDPRLAVMAYGTVTTASGYTYENVTAIQLAYLMDDVEICNMMLAYINKLPKPMQEKANDQLTKKMAEVAVQHSQFKPFDFNSLVQAITTDQMLINAGKPSPETEKVLAQFKEDLKPSIIKEGKSWIKEHLQEGFRIYDQNWNLWGGNQRRWYLINVIGHIETLAEKCFEQECSQGLKEIVEKNPSRRSSAIKNYIINNYIIKNYNYIKDLPLTYRGSPDSSLLLGRDFFVEIYFGGGWGRSVHVVKGEEPWSSGALKFYAEQRDQAWKNLSSSLTSSNHQTNRY